MSDQDPGDTFTRTPANRLLGLELVSRSASSATVRMPAAATLRQEEGVVHGGFLATLADTAAVYALLPELPADARLPGIEFKINFLNPARVGGPDLLAVSRLVKRGRSLAVLDVSVTQGDVPIATGLFTYMLVTS